MPRTLNLIAHAVRRDAFLDAAQALITTKGYDALSVQDVLAAVGASKGAFYHYFDSKTALLDAVIGRMVDAGLAAGAATLADPALPAPQKLAAFAASLAQFKAGQRDFLVALIEVWLSEDNAVVREGFRRRGRVALLPVMRSVIHQGVAEGTFDVEDVDATAVVFVNLILGLNEVATELYLANHNGTVSLAEVERQFVAYSASVNRILGAPPGTVVLGDPAVIREWFSDTPAQGGVAYVEAPRS
jgi:AcrR family transcriptional regulator